MLRIKLDDLRINKWKYLRLLSVQVSILVIFQGVAVLLSHAPVWGHAVITVGIPVLRAALKRVIWRLSSCLEDISTDVGVCVIEIFGSLFQNVCLQNARSVGVSALIIFVDFTQAAIETRLYMEHKFVVDGRHTTRTAVKTLEGALHFGVLNARKTTRLLKQRPDSTVVGVTRTGNSVMLSPLEVHRKAKKVSTRYSTSNNIAKILATTENALNAEAIDLGDIASGVNSQEAKDGHHTLRPIISLTAFAPKRSLNIDDVENPHRHHAKILSQGLQLVFASEVLVFAEYAEFACSVLYGLYTELLYHLPYAKYNLFFIGLSQSQFKGCVANTFAYAAF
ncbi:unnamed protein product [Phytophthora lilii]|uniref:Unnamed protein product n=1 Tax=Phytophthora lilii TaxID=2077276 RepID=A0A9W6TGX9_9STRA|nr:unnamed protein product [Phytophthora lilii]